MCDLLKWSLGKITSNFVWKLSQRKKVEKTTKVSHQIHEYFHRLASKQINDRCNCGVCRSGKRELHKCFIGKCTNWETFQFHHYQLQVIRIQIVQPLRFTIIFHYQWNVWRSKSVFIELIRASIFICLVRGFGLRYAQRISSVQLDQNDEDHSVVILMKKTGTHGEHGNFA